MKRLIAKFRIELVPYILIQTIETNFLRQEFQIDNANVEVRFVLFDSYRSSGYRTKKKGQRTWSYPVDTIEIFVSLPESEVPPPADITPTPGYGSYYEIEKYFEKRIANYTGIAKKVFRRLIRYFKYKHGMPHLSDENNPSNFPLPVWIDENSKEIWKTKNRTVFAKYVPGMHIQEFGIKKFRTINKKNLNTAIINDIDVTLWQEIMSNAQTAFLENNYRRGILEMAIACEIAIKQSFFSKDSISGIAYEYLENQGRIRISPIDLISKVAENTFGDNFKKFNEKAYNDIDYLFRCRNSIAHRGEISYRNDKGVLLIPDNKTIRKWCDSVDMMLVWLKKVNP